MAGAAEKVGGGHAQGFDIKGMPHFFFMEFMNISVVLQFFWQ